MTAMPSLVLLDVNVLVDNYLPGRQTASDSRALLDWLGSHGVGICYPVTAPGTVFYLVQQALKQVARADGVTLSDNDALAIREIAWGCVENLAEIGAPVGADASDFWAARKLRPVHADLEDNMVIAAAERSQASYLITNDAALLRKCPVPALSPHDFLAAFLDE